MTVGEVLAILNEVDPERNVYLKDDDGTAQLVTVVGDLEHVNGIEGVKIPNDVYLMTSRQFEEFSDTHDE